MVFLPSAVSGITISILGSFAVIVVREFNAEIIPGAMATPRISGFLETATKAVAVPNDTMMAGRECLTDAPTARQRRSDPSSFGFSACMPIPVFMPGLTTMLFLASTFSMALSISGVTGGTTEDIIAPSNWFGSSLSSLSRDLSMIAYSSEVFIVSVATLKLAMRLTESKTPNLMFVLPQSMQSVSFPEDIIIIYLCFLSNHF